MTTETQQDPVNDEAELVYEHLECDLEDGIATLTVNRPKALNALNSEVLDELRDAIVELAIDDEVMAIMITGAGDKAFVAGADISEMADMTAFEARDHSHLGQDVFATIEACPKPVIAVINGYALGGGLELALACHLRIASSSAMMGLPEVSLGLIPGFAGTQRLARIAGPGVAREWIMTGDSFSAAEAHRVGVVNRVAEPEQLMEAATELTKRIVSRGPLAVQTALEVIRTGLEVGQAQGESAEADSFGLIFTSDDAREGMLAFKEKRKPSFTGR
ncbi:MAG: enoyl-CoA hydratase/isomerase family protein [Planctomycetes bacterium]|nr:enoyl-CoA hydratase/isomerase family protein [Planctomycetota bacterium]